MNIRMQGCTRSRRHVPAGGCSSLAGVDSNVAHHVRCWRQLTVSLQKGSVKAGNAQVQEIGLLLERGWEMLGFAALIAG